MLSAAGSLVTNEGPISRVDYLLIIVGAGPGEAAEVMTNFVARNI